VVAVAVFTPPEALALAATAAEVLAMGLLERKTEEVVEAAQSQTATLEAREVLELSSSARLRPPHLQLAAQLSLRVAV
jgi:hypothetical protein